jgi:hypothetical protein
MYFLCQFDQFVCLKANECFPFVSLSMLSVAETDTDLRCYVVIAIILS